MPEIHSKKTSSHSCTMGTWNLKYHMLLCKHMDFTFSNIREYAVFTILPKMNSKQLYSNLEVCISYVVHNRNSMCLTELSLLLLLLLPPPQPPPPPLLLITTFVQGIYNYIAQTNHTSRVHTIPAIL